MYFWLRENWTLDNTIVDTPDIENEEIDFLSGEPIKMPLKNKIIFQTTYAGNNQPHHYFDYGTSIPVVSKQFVDALMIAGIDNFELFAAMLESRVDGTRWDNYFAINVIGMVDAVDKENSMYNEVMGGEDGGMSSMGAFTVIALREKEIINFDFFREPIGNNLIISERALNKVVECFPNGGAGIIAHEVILT